jgi:hypothetical protein
MTGEVVSVDGSRRVASLRFPAGHEGWCALEIPPLAPGVYRITVRAHRVADDVSDLFVVSRRLP